MRGGEIPMPNETENTEPPDDPDIRTPMKAPKDIDHEFNLSALERAGVPHRTPAVSMDCPA
jgi:hypothetical protein